MKGLMYKDLLSVLKVTWSYLVIGAVLLAVSLIAEQKFMGLYAFAFIGMIPLSLIAYDEQEKWNVYSCTLPVTKSQYVFSKYLTGFILLLLYSITYLLLLCCAFGFTADNFITGAVGMMTGMIISGISMPFPFAFGYIKGRIASIIFAFVIFGFAGVVMGSGRGENVIDLLSASNGDFSAAICVIVLLSVVAMYFLSMIISAVLYKKRRL